MPAPDELSLSAERLEAIGALYMVTGTTAAILYGQPRVTNDLDVVLSLDDPARAALLDAFPAAAFYVPPEAAHPNIRPISGRFRRSRGWTRPCSQLGWSAWARAASGRN